MTSQSDVPTIPDQQDSAPPVLGAAQLASPDAQPVPEPRRRRNRWKIAAIVLGVGLLLSLLGGVAGTGVMTLAAAELQREVTAQKATIDTTAAEEKVLRDQFHEEDFGVLHEKVTQAAAKQKQSFDAAMSTAQDGRVPEKAYIAWEAAVADCFRAVARYNETARDYPADWFGATPALVSVNNGGVECFSA